MDILIISAWIIILTAIVSIIGFFFRQYRKFQNNRIDLQRWIDEFNNNQLSTLNRGLFASNHLPVQTLEEILRLYETRGEDIKKESIEVYRAFYNINNLSKSIKFWNKSFFWIKDNGGVKISKKLYLKTPAGRKQVLAGLVVALLVVSFEALRYGISALYEYIIYGASVEIATKTWSYLVGFIATAIGLIAFIQWLYKKI